MGIRRGSISTPTIVDGLIFNIDPANRVSSTPISNLDTVYNTLDSSIEGSITNELDMWDNSTITPSFAFDGSSDRIQLNTQYLNKYNDVGPKNTCNIWVKYLDDYNAILIGGSVFNSGGHFLYASPSNAYSSYGGSSTGQGIWSSFGTDVWINYCVTKNDKGEVIWYGNGQQLDTSNVVPNASIGFWSIGAYDEGDFSLNGNIGIIQIYNRALSSNEVLHNYNALKGRFGL